MLWGLLVYIFLGGTDNAAGCCNKAGTGGRLLQLEKSGGCQAEPRNKRDFQLVEAPLADLQCKSTRGPSIPLIAGLMTSLLIVHKVVYPMADKNYFLPPVP